MNDRNALSEYLVQQLHHHPKRAELIAILSEIATIGKIISTEINRAGIADIFGATGESNTHGQQVQKFDIRTNDLCKEYLSRTGHFCVLASEEDEGVIDPGEDGKNGQFVIAFDPLDGSSNIDVNGSVGTIFSVHKKRDDVPAVSEEQFFQKGSEQVLAGYILYGSSTVLVYSFGDGVREFTLDPEIGEFFLSNPSLRVPERASYYSVNEGKMRVARPKDQTFVELLKTEKQLGLRYIGTYVADLHRNLIKGGVFLYPALDEKNTGVFKPKLRLNYEVKPLSFIMAEAGGKSTNGEMNILDIVPTSLHEMQAVISGNLDLVDLYSSLT